MFPLKKTVCLNMIVKDEASIIEETLSNILENVPIDYWVIADTGSSDDTIDKIVHFFNERQIPGEISQDEWVNFGYNRNLALERCRGKSDYIFFFDADDRFYGEFEFPRELMADVYLMNMRLNHTGLFYTRPLLIANRPEFRWKGIIHEFIDIHSTTGRIVSLNDDNYYVNSGKFGARSQAPDKLLRDAETLEQAFYHPDEIELRPRYAMNCAKANHAAGRLEKAKEWFQRALTMDLPDEERFHILCQLGELYESMSEFKEAFMTYAKAHKEQPHRLEASYYLTRFLRKQGQLAKAYHVAMRARPIALNKSSFLSGRRDIYDYLFSYELVELAAHFQEFSVANDAGQKVLLSKLAPDSIKDNVLKKLVLFKAQWSELSRQDLKTIRDYISNHVMTSREFSDLEQTLEEILKSKPVKRILFLHPFLMVGGVETVLKNYLELLTKDGHYDVDLVLAEYVGREYYRGIPKHVKVETLLNRIETEFLTLAHHKVMDPLLAEDDKTYYHSWYFGIREELNQRLLKKISRDQYDLVIDFKDSFLSHFSESVSKINLPILYWVHSDDYFERWESYRENYRDIFKHISGIVSICQDMSKRVDQEISRLSLDNEQLRYYTVYNPIHLKKIEEDSLKEVSPEDRGLLEQPFMVEVSRLYEPQKNLIELVNIYHELRNKHGVTEKLYIIGEGVSRPLLESRIKELGLEDDCLLLGVKFNPYPFITRAKLFLHTANYEGLPTVLIESFVCQTPVVAYNCPTGPREILMDGNLGELVPLHDSQAFIESVTKLLSDPVQAVDLSQKAYRSLDRFTEDSIFKVVDDLFQSL